MSKTTLLKHRVTTFAQAFQFTFFLLNMFMKSAMIPHLKLFEVFRRNIFWLEN